MLPQAVLPQAVLHALHGHGDGDRPTGLPAQASESVPVSDAALDGSGLDFTTTTGATFSGTVADLLDANSYATTQDFTATIDWGDGSQPSAGTVSGSGGVFTISGGHSYALAGSYTVTVTITDDGGSTTTATATATVEAAWGAQGSARGADPARAFLQGIAEGQVDLGQGAVRLSQALDFDQSLAREKADRIMPWYARRSADQSQGAQ